MASDQRERGHLFRKKRSPRRSAPRDDTGINALILGQKIKQGDEEGLNKLKKNGMRLLKKYHFLSEKGF